MYKYKYLTKKYLISLLIGLLNIIFIGCNKKNEALLHDTTLQQTESWQNDLKTVLFSKLCEWINENKIQAIEKEILQALSDEQIGYLLIKCRNQYHYTAFQLAIQEKNTEMVKLLWNVLTDKQKKQAIMHNKCKKGYTTMHLAVINGNLEIVKLLYDWLTPQQKVTTLTYTDNKGYTALHLAIISGNTTMVKLLDNGLSPEQKLGLVMRKDNEGYMTMHLAVICGNIAMVKQIGTWIPANMKKMDTQCKDPEGNNVLHLAALQNKEKIIAFIVKKCPTPPLSDMVHLLLTHNNAGKLPCECSQYEPIRKNLQQLTNGVLFMQKLQNRKKGGVMKGNC